MKVTIEPSVDSTEAKVNLTFFAGALGAGIAASVLAAALEESYLISTILVFVVGAVSVMILRMAVYVAREPSLRRLILIGFVTLIAPWFLLLLLLGMHMSVAHDAGGFCMVYYMPGCTIAGLGLLVTASVRFIRERRKRTPSAQ